MADDTPQDETTDDGTVTLVSPNGDEVDVRNPEAINNLVYGAGYRLKGDSNPEAAIKAAQDTDTGDTDGGKTAEVTAAPTTQTGSKPSTTTKAGGKASAPPTT